MNWKSGLILSLTLLFLSACTLDHYFPNDLKGKVKHNIYVANIGYSHDKFNILIPQENNQFEINVVPTEETYKKDLTFVMFGGTDTDETAYRLLVVKKGQMSLEEFKATYFPRLITMTAKGDDRQMFETYHTRATILGQPAIFNLYTQTVRGIYQYINTKQSGLITLTHAIYFVDFGDYGVIFWIQATSESPMYGITSQNIREIKRQTWLPMVQFVRSFKIVPTLPGTVQE